MGIPFGIAGLRTLIPGYAGLASENASRLSNLAKEAQPRTNRHGTVLAPTLSHLDVAEILAGDAPGEDSDDTHALLKAISYDLRGTRHNPKHRSIWEDPKTTSLAQRVFSPLDDIAEEVIKAGFGGMVGVTAVGIAHALSGVAPGAEFLGAIFAGSALAAAPISDLFTAMDQDLNTRAGFDGLINGLLSGDEQQRRQCYDALVYFDRIPEANARLTDLSDRETATGHAAWQVRQEIERWERQRLRG